MKGIEVAHPKIGFMFDFLPLSTLDINPSGRTCSIRTQTWHRMRSGTWKSDPSFHHEILDLWQTVQQLKKENEKMFIIKKKKERELINLHIISPIYHTLILWLIKHIQALGNIN